MFALSQQSDPKASEALRALAKRRDAPVAVREKAIFWLGQSKDGGPDYLRTLFPRLALAQTKDPAAVDKLIGIAKNDTDKELRKRALFWLGQSRDPRVADVLEQMLKE